MRSWPATGEVAPAVAPASGPAPFDVVVGIGGGSVLDTAKAVAGLLIPGNSVMDHLEGVGPELPYRGPSVPFVAVPTTAGTGSEATKNAVLSVRGAGGFKKSFRDEALVARVAIVDPDLLAACPPELIAGNGMDALTQLLESYVSTKANPFTDALALSGLAAARDGLLAWFEEVAAARGAAGPGSVAAVAREQMAYAALCSGICLAQAGLGAVHGLASPLGAQYPIPHGAACGATLVAATRVNIAALEARDPGNRALSRYAAAGRLFTGRCRCRRSRGALGPGLGPGVADRPPRHPAPIRLRHHRVVDSGAGRRLARQQHEDEPRRAHRRRDRLDPAGVALGRAARAGSGGARAADS